MNARNKILSLPRNERIYLSEVRKVLRGMSKREQDSLLLGMQRAGEVVLYRFDNPAEMSPESDAAAIHIAGNPRHLLYVDARAPMPDVKGEAFVQKVLSAARVSRRRFGPDKVFISSIRGKFRMPREEFEARLIEAHRTGQVVLSRADLVSAMDPKDVRDSEILHLGASYHFINVPQGAAPKKKARKKMAAKKKKKTKKKGRKKAGRKKKTTRKKGRKKSGRKKSRKKAKGNVPLEVLEERLQNLNNIVRRRGGAHF